MLRTWHIAIACGFVVLAAGPAVAQSDLDEAKEHYRNAETAMQQKSFAAAAAAYQRAYEFSKDPVLFYKIGSAHQQAGNCDAAVPFYERYLAEGKPDEQFKTLTRERITACKNGTATGGANGPAGSPERSPKGSPEGSNDPSDPGSEPGGAPEQDKPPADPLAGGSAGSGDAAGADFSRGEVPPTFVHRKPSWQRSAAWVSVGISLALLSTGGVLALSASSREEDIQNLIDFRNPATGRPSTYSGTAMQRYDELIDEGEQLRVYSAVAFGAAAAAAAAGVVFFVIDPGRGQGRATGGVIASNPRASRVSIVPVATLDALGVAAGWQF